MTLTKFKKKFPIETFSNIVRLEAEYNECGGYITGFTANDEPVNIYFSSDKDEVYLLADEIADWLDIDIS